MWHPCETTLSYSLGGTELVDDLDISPTRTLPWPAYSLLIEEAAAPASGPRHRSSWYLNKPVLVSWTEDKRSGEAFSRGPDAVSSARRFRASDGSGHLVLRDRTPMCYLVQVFFCMILTCLILRAAQSLPWVQGTRSSKCCLGGISGYSSSFSPSASSSHTR